MELLVPAQPRGLVGDVPPRVGRREHLKAVHGSEKAFYRLGLSVIRPSVDGFDSKVLVQSAGNDRASGIPDLSQERFLRKILAMPALEEPRPERLAVVDVDDAGDAPQPDAGPPERACYAGHILRRHDLPAQRHGASPVQEQHQRHAAGLARLRVDGLEIQVVAVRNHDFPDFHKSPVSLDGYAAVVVPRLFPAPEERPGVKAGSFVPLDEAPHRVFRRNGKPLGLATRLDVVHARADLRRVGKKYLPLDDGLVLFREHALAPVAHPAPVNQSPQPLLPADQLPLFQRLPANIRPDNQQDVHPVSGLVRHDEVLLFLHRGPVPALPLQIEIQQVRLKGCLVRALRVHQVPRVPRRYKVAALLERRKKGVVCRLRLNGQAAFRHLDGVLCLQRHGGNKPFLPATTSFARAELPAFTFRT